MKIGIDIGGSHVAVGLVDNEYKLIAKKEISRKDLNKDKRIENQIEDTIVKFIKELLKTNNEIEDNIEIIGIGVPGTVKDGVIYNAVNLNIDGFNIKNAISKHFKAKIYVQNDCKCSAICEKELGSLKEFEDCIFLALGTGIGGAAFINNKMLIPKRYSGFEFGHIVINKEGNICKCGNKGCFETYGSMKKFKEDLIKEFNLNQNTHGKEIYEYMKQNSENDKMKKLIEKYVSDLGTGIINIINIFEPEAVVLGGSFAYYGDILLTELKEYIKEKLFNKCCPILITAKYRNDAGLIGATMLDKYEIK